MQHLFSISKWLSPKFRRPVIRYGLNNIRDADDLTAFGMRGISAQMRSGDPARADHRHAYLCHSLPFEAGQRNAAHEGLLREEKQHDRRQHR